MIENSKEITLGEIITTQKGYAFKSKWYQDYGVPVVRVSDFTDNSISIDQLNYIPELIAKDYGRYKLQKWDIIVQTVGSWQHNPASIVGKVISVPEELNSALLNQNAVKLIPEPNVNKRFLYYLLKENAFKQHNLNHAQGAANQASITLESIKRFKFYLPSFKIQQKIASILSAYDDLIENNLKRIKLLEQKAQLTYEEWFVRMKFPGHESAKIDKESGLPEGWEKVKLEDILTLNYGKALKASNRIKGNYWVYGSSGVVGSHNSFLVSGPGVIVGRKGNVGSVFWADHNFYAIDTVYYVNSNFNLYYCYFYLKGESFVNNDAAVPGLSRKAAYLKDAVKPSTEITENFESEIKPYFDSVRNLKNQSQLLKEARDILLPRLMSGMIDPSTSSGQVVEKLNTEDIKEQALGMVAEDETNYEHN